MPGRESAAVERAVAASLADPKLRLKPLAAEHGIALSSLRLALRRRGVEPRQSISGPDHPMYIDGRTSARLRRGVGAGDQGGSGDAHQVGAA